MDIRKLQRAIVDGLEDVKAKDIVVFNTEALSPLFERVIIASGASNRQTKALAASVREAVKGRGMQVLATEGESSGEWVIVDCGAAVAHIMQPSIRDYYRLEEIWGGKKVSMKLDGAAPASGAAAARPAPREPTKPMKAVAKSAPPSKSAAKKPRFTSGPGKAAPARRPAAKKAAQKAAMKAAMKAALARTAAPRKSTKPRV